MQVGGPQIWEAGARHLGTGGAIDIITVPNFVALGQTVLA